jgi:hypothetical protein
MMEQTSENRLPRQFIDALADIPSLPRHLYSNVKRKLDAKLLVVRSAWALAASILIAISAFQAVHLSASHNTYVAEAADELSGVSSYINSDVYRENDNSYAFYEEVLYKE